MEGQCHPGTYADCNGSYNKVQCCAAEMNGRKIGPSPSECYWTWGNYGVPLECRGNESVITGRCGSGKRRGNQISLIF